MDIERFDAIVKELSTRASRRRVLAGALLGGLLTQPPFGVRYDALAKKKKNKKKKKKKRPPTPSQPPLLPPCDDGVACTDDARAANGTCIHTPNDSHCRANQVCHRVQGCSCGTGFRNCSGNPAGDGCECQTPGCCRNGFCQTTHSTGLGQSFYDCVDLGTHDQTQAEKARAAFAEDFGPGLTINDTCGGPGETSKMLCHEIEGLVCACWAWSGPLSGFVSAVGDPEPCRCPTTADAPWN